MRQLTIAERRALQLENFNSKYIDNLKEASTLINKFYRLAGLCDRVFMLENDERHWNSNYTKELRDKMEHRANVLRDELEKYGLTISFYSWMPTICELKDGREAYCSIYYN